ncbi:MAG: hypothetical protein QOH21_2722 [Acidobacteriota bacterium]|nr:hypothetical protein [Acidobacteriota bacterium]
MKRAVLVVATMLALLPLRAGASESFTLTIPQRFDASQETGEVRIVLGLNAAPAGAQLVVGGSTTIALGATQTVAGDSVSFESAPGNRVMIRYKPLSNFGADFCAGANAVEKSIALRFQGAQDVIDFRMSSFVVAAPAAECSAASRRVVDLSASIAATADGVAPALSATDMGRLPLDVILVLDKSGSIADLPPEANPGSMTTKVQILKAAMNAFVANWREIDAPSGGANWSEDRLGVVFFDNTATPQTLAGADAPANFFVQRGSSATPGPWDAVLGAIGGLTPGGSTSIGAGINAAMQQWKADPSHDATLVLVTDGIQNTAPLIAPTASGFLGLAPVSGLPDELRKRFIPIQALGFGVPATVDEELLRNIALETAGRSYIGVNAATVYDDLAMTLVAILKGNTASIATRHSATLTGTGPTAPRSVLVDPSARRVVFSLQWTPPLRDALVLQVFRPGSTSVAAPTRRESLPEASLQTFDLGSKADVGTWSVRVARNPRSNDRRTPVPYTLNVFFLESHLDYRLSLQPARATVGQPVRLRAEISYDGKPLRGLPPGALRVRVLRPSATLATVLRGAKTGRNRPAPGGDPQTDLQRQIDALSPAAVAKLLPSEAETVAFREEKNGIYTANITKPAITGSYAFEVVLDWNDPRTGHVHREERLEEMATERR